MNSFLVGAIVFASVFSAALLALRLRAKLPDHHLGADTKDTVKLAMGLVATMSALVLGLLVASAKGSYDTQRTELIQMSGKVVFLDRVLSHYGPEAAAARAALRQAVDGALAQLWPANSRSPVELTPNLARAAAFSEAIQKLAPQSDSQKQLKTQALAVAMDLEQMRWLLFEQSGTTISTPLVVVVIGWLAILFFSFGLFGPSNGTAITALLVSALAVAGAIFLILELDRPFGGLIKLSNQPVLNALSQLGR